LRREATVIEPVPWYKSRTIIASIVMAALAILRLCGVEVGDAPVDTIIDGILAVLAILVTYWRLEPSPPKPLSTGQVDAIYRAAHSPREGQR
jgi:hypothetical protein